MQKIGGIYLHIHKNYKKKEKEVEIWKFLGIEGPFFNSKTLFKKKIPFSQNELINFEKEMEETEKIWNEMIKGVKKI